MQAPSRVAQTRLIKSFPNYAIDDIVEVLYNMMLNNVKIKNPTHKKIITTHKRKLVTLFNNSKKKRYRRNFIRKQKGGFIGAVLPIVASVLASALL